MGLKITTRANERNIPGMFDTINDKREGFFSDFSKARLFLLVYNEN